jgi:HSP20 family protein
MMTFTRSAFPDARRLQQQLEWLFGDVGSAWGAPLTGEYPPLNIARDDQGIAIEALCPGIDRDSLEVTVVGDALTIKGERKAEPSVPPEAYHRRERLVGTFTRSVSLRDPLDPDKTAASYDDGILRVRVSRAPQRPPKRIEIQS